MQELLHKAIFDVSSANRHFRAAVVKAFPARSGVRDNLDKRAGGSDMNPDSITTSAGPRMRTALLLAIIADAFQIVFSPLLFEGAASPADDILDLCMAGILSYLLGWHWEFLPSFFAKLVPGVDLVPLWTLAVANVYRKSKRLSLTMEARVGNATERHARP